MSCSVLGVHVNRVLRELFFFYQRGWLALSRVVKTGALGVGD